MSCENCGIRKAIILRPKNKMKVCKECFFELFEDEIHSLIVNTNMFERNSRIGVGISGGKDSTVLAYILNKLNKKYDYGLNLILLCVDEGISGYRDRSIDTVYENQKILGLDLEIVSYQQIFGMTMDDNVKIIGKKGNCTYCGVLRRQSLEEAARIKQCDCIVTGHNADDLAETILLNFFRGDISRLKRCTLSKTKDQLSLDNEATDSEHTENTVLDTNTTHAVSSNIGTVKPDSINQINEKINTLKINEDIQNKQQYLSLARCKPFKYSYQKEIVFYAYFKKLPYFSTECTYAPGASRGDFRTLIKDLEKVDSEIILKIIKSGEQLLDSTPTVLKIKKCKNCSHPTSSKDQICTACGMIEKLKTMQNSSHCCHNE
jgi:cytoplasmic tRNA 2-thiolation protein 1